MSDQPANRKKKKQKSQKAATVALEQGFGASVLCATYCLLAKHNEGILNNLNKAMGDYIGANGFLGMSFVNISRILLAIRDDAPFYLDVVGKELLISLLAAQTFDMAFQAGHLVAGCKVEDMCTPMRAIVETAGPSLVAAGMHYAYGKFRRFGFFSSSSSNGYANIKESQPNYSSTDEQMEGGKLLPVATGLGQSRSS